MAVKLKSSARPKPDVIPGYFGSIPTHGINNNRNFVNLDMNQECENPLSEIVYWVILGNLD